MRAFACVAALVMLAGAGVAPSLGDAGLSPRSAEAAQEPRAVVLFESPAPGGGSAVLELTNPAGLGRMAFWVTFEASRAPAPIQLLAWSEGSAPEVWDLRLDLIGSGSTLSLGSPAGALHAPPPRERERTPHSSFAVERAVTATTMRLALLWAEQEGPVALHAVLPAGTTADVLGAGEGAERWRADAEGDGVGARATVGFIGVGTAALGRQRAFDAADGAFVYVHYVRGDLAGAGQLRVSVDEEDATVDLSAAYDPLDECIAFSAGFLVGHAAERALVSLDYAGDGRTDVEVVVARAPAGLAPPFGLAVLGPERPPGC